MYDDKKCESDPSEDKGGLNDSKYKIPHSVTK